MWCWHRIRESESGLCPACRTPYGEDPHQFSAVDVDEVLKANKEKEAAAKRDRQKQHGDSVTEDGEMMNGVEVPKDRTQLANMRVIRRNLVYAVGLPPSIANEDVLRRPDYFGQYGKIAKIVLNRSQATGGGDSRRASASSYVTFAQKEDTLACILALDGMFLENRNIRASYGTSKYCSAFIKNVRCNNPECTYLHEMGSPEDTFTKQEIQAGYVTSGRDVLARQQQIVAEQLRQAGSSGGAPRKRAGGGGPSGTGRSASTPVFPPPEYDEPARVTLPLVPAPSGISRASTVTAAPTLPPAPASAVAATKISRSASVGTRSPPLGALAGPAARSKASAATAASVVAGMHSIAVKAENPDPHTTLTPLTPLKRAAKAGNKSSNVSVGSDEGKPEPPRNAGKRQNSRNATATSVAAPPPSNDGSPSIGGAVIGPPMKARTNAMAPGLGNDATAPGVSSLGGQPINMDSLGPSLSSSLGGEIFTGELPNGHNSMIGGGNDKWNSGHIGGATLSTGPMLGAGGGGGFWGGAPSHSQGLGQALPGGGNGGVIGSHISNNGDSSSALASILGINLPTGSGSLHESSNLWPSQQAPSGPSALSSLNGTAMPSQGAIGPSSLKSGSSLIGGIPIGGRNGSMNQSGSDGSKSDIALLQSLLPGVHITTGHESYGLGGMGPGGGWDSAPGRPNQGMNLGGLNGNAPIGGSWAGPMSAPAGSVGAIGQNNGQQDRRQGPGIW
jgi:CCR4-NOT transcription complex subunit 4